MTFPAWDAFDGDGRIRTRHVKVYRYCRQTLDFREIRMAKREQVSLKTGVHQSDVTRTLTALVQWGYLVEHERDEDGARRFTLAWSRGGGKTPPTESAEPERLSA